MAKTPIVIHNLRHSKALTWLHLSDIHFGEKRSDEQRAVLNRLIDDVRERREKDNLAPDLVFVTGDIAWSGKPEQYREDALPFLTKLMEAAAVERDRVFLIPGNHDVDRSLVNKRSLRLLQDDLIENGAADDERLIHSFLNDPSSDDDRRDVLRKHEAYESFVREHFPHCAPRFDPVAYTAQILLPPDELPFRRLWVLGLNSAWLGRDGEAKGNLLLGYPQIFRALNAVEREGKPHEDFIIALTHHPLSWLPEWDERLCKQQIAARCDFHLSGHLHEHEFNLTGVAGPQRCSGIAAGSAFGGSQWVNGYHFVRLDFQSRTGRAFVRDYQPKRVKFVPSNEFDTPGLFEWELKGRFRTPSKTDTSDERPAVPPETVETAYVEELKKSVRYVRVLGEKDFEQRELTHIFVDLTIVEEFERHPGDEWKGLMDVTLRKRRELFSDDDERPNPGDKWKGLMDVTLRKRRELFSDDDERPTPDGETRKIRQTVKPDELLKPGTRAMVVGAPGCGKTTLVRFLAGKTDESRLPLFIELKRLRDADFEQAGLADLLFEQAVKLTGNYVQDLSFQTRTRDDFKRRFFARLGVGEVSVFLDGLDEVRNKRFFPVLCEWLMEFVRTAPGNLSVVVTTRPYAFDRSFDGYKAMEIAPPTQPQIEACLTNYYAGTHGDAVRKLIEEIRKRRDLADLASAPLLLQVIAVEYFKSGELLDDRLTLYERIVDRLADRIDVEKNLDRDRFYFTDGGAARRRRDFLERLAYKGLFETNAASDVERLVFTQDDIEIEAKKFCERLALDPYNFAADIVATPLLREIDEKTHAFTHLTLQEYLAARALAVRDDCETVFCRAYFNPTLSEMEVLPMTLGLLRDADRREKLYDQLEGLPESLRFTNLRLRARSLAYVASVTHTRLDVLIARLINFILWRNKEETPYSGIILHGFRLARSKHKKRVSARLMKALRDANGDVRVRAAEALGRLGAGTEGVVTGLLEALRDANGDVRVRAAEALGQSGAETEGVVTGLLEALRDANGDVRASAAEALGRLGMGTPEVITSLLGLVRDADKYVRASAAEALGWLGIGTLEVAKSLFRLMLDDFDLVRARAAKAVGRLGVGTPEVVMGLLRLMQDPNRSVQVSAAEALGRLDAGTPGVVMGLLGLMQNADWSVRMRTAEVLGGLGARTPTVVNGLFKLEQDFSGSVRVSAAEALVRLRVRTPVTSLLGLLLDGSSWVRARAVEALGRFGTGTPEIVTSLLGLLQDADWSVRVSVAEALGRLGIGTQKAGTGLLGLVRDGSSSVRARSAKALGRLGAGTPEVVTGLLRLVRDDDSDVRAAAAAALDKISLRSGDTFSDNLEPCLTAKDRIVRRKAAQVIGYYAENEEVLRKLHDLALNDPTEEVRQAAADAKIRYIRKLELFGKPVPELTEDLGREKNLEETRAYIAHEVRSSVVPLAGFAEFLEQELTKQGVTNGKISEYLQRIHQQSDIALEVVNRFLEYSQPLAFELKSTDINALTNQILIEFESECRDRNVVVFKQLQPVEPVRGDGGLLTQVLRNVFRNALEAMESDGTLTVSSRNDGQSVVLEITDTGTGIKPKHLPHVFDLGFTTKLGRQVAGVGLAFVRRIVREGHHGDVSIQNNPNGVGATVAITLPVETEMKTNGDGNNPVTHR